MKTMQNLSVGVVATTVLLGLIACSDMNTREMDTAIGAGVGAFAGSVLKGCSKARPMP